MKRVLVRMKEKSAPDQPACNWALWDGGRGRSKDDLDPEVWSGVEALGATRFALLPQIRFARHAGDALGAAPGRNIHVLHPTDEGYRIQFGWYAAVLPPELSGRTAPLNTTIKAACGVGKWVERTAFRPREQEILHCAGLWMLRVRCEGKLCKHGFPWPELIPGESAVDFVRRASWVGRALPPNNEGRGAAVPPLLAGI